MTFKVLIFLLLTILSYAQGADNREIVRDTQKFAAIGQLAGRLPPHVRGFKMENMAIQARFITNSRRGLSTDFNFCTAVLITSNKLVTAAHCAQTYLWLKSLNIKVDFVSASKRARPVEIKAVFNMNIAVDWAILSLENELTDINPMQFFKLRKTDEQKITLLSVGYPYTVRGLEYFGEKLFSSSCGLLSETEKQKYTDIEQLRNDMYLTNCFITKGNSGGPILVDTGEEYYIIGINAFNLIKGDQVGGLAVPARVILNAIKE